MKLIFTLIGLVIFFSVDARATVCNEDGSYCKRVEKVLIEGQWLQACCDNVSIPEGWSCRDDCRLAKTGSRSSTIYPQMNSANAYVLMENGYRIWISVKNQLVSVPEMYFDSEELREFLPLAQNLFRMNSKVRRVSFLYSDDIRIVVEVPEDREQLSEAIIFKDYSAYEKRKTEEANEYLESKIDLYPNPATEVLNFKIRSSRSIKIIEVLDISGKQLKLVSFNTGKDIKEFQLPLDFIEQDGYYLIQIEDTKGKIYLHQIKLDKP